MDQEFTDRATVFGSVAEQYQRWRPAYPDAALDWLLDAGVGEVLDLAAGTGKLTGALLARRLTVHAVEPDAAMLAVLRRDHAGAKAQIGTASSIPLPAASVDAVLVAQAWHWFDYATAVPEIVRVLRPTGWLGVIANQPDPLERWQQEFAALQPDRFVNAETDERVALDGIPLDAQVEQAIFSWTWLRTPAQLRADIATHSAYVVMAKHERNRRLDKAEQVATAQAARRGEATLPYRMRTRCVRVRFPG